MSDKKISNLICAHGVSTNNLLDDNPYLCEVGTFLTLRARVKQMQQSGQLMLEYRKRMATNQKLDDRFIDSDEDLNNETFEEMDEIDKFNTAQALHQKLENGVQNAIDASEVTQTTKVSTDTEKTSEKTSESAESAEN